MLCFTILTMQLVEVESHCIAPRMYVTGKVYSHSFIRTQLRLSNLSANCPLVKAWNLPPLSTTIDSKFEKPFRHNCPPLLVKMSALLFDSQGNDWITKAIGKQVNSNQA